MWLRCFVCKPEILNGWMTFVVLPFCLRCSSHRRLVKPGRLVGHHVVGRHVPARRWPGDGHLSGMLSNPRHRCRHGTKPGLFPGKIDCCNILHSIPTDPLGISHVHCRRTHRPRINPRRTHWVSLTRKGDDDPVSHLAQSFPPR